jgi:hypothetical protein
MTQKMSRRARVLLAAFLALWLPLLLLAALEGYGEERIRFPSRLGGSVVLAAEHPVLFHFTLGFYVAIAAGLGLVAWRLVRARP